MIRKRIVSLKIKYNTVPASVKSAVAFTISSLVLRGITFLVTPIFTRLMSTTQYGIVSTYNSWQTILEVFALLGLTSAGVFNVGLNDYRNERDQYISSLILLTNISTLITFAIVCVIKLILGSSTILPYGLLILMFVQFFFSPAQTFWVTRQRYEYKYKLATTITIMSAIVTQIFAVFCVLNVNADEAAIAKLWGTGLASLCFFIPFYVYLLFKGKGGVNKKIWRQTLFFALPLLPHYLAQHVMAGADRIMIAKLASQADAGVYSVVSAISLIATVIWSAINASLTPYVFEKMNNKRYKDIDNVVFKLICLYGVMCLGVALIAPEVLAILAPSEYKYGVYAVPPIAAVAFLNALYNVYSMAEFYHKYSKNIAFATIISCIFNIILNLLFIPRFGFVAAAYTTLASNIILVMLHYKGYRKCQKERIFKDYKYLIVAIVFIVLCELCVLLYKNFFLRIIVILVTLILVFMKRKLFFLKFKSE